MSKKSANLGTPTSSSARVQRAGEDTGVPRKITPRLRFPEFRDAGEWTLVTLESVSVPVTERVGQRRLTPVSISVSVR